MYCILVVTTWPEKEAIMQLPNIAYMSAFMKDGCGDHFIFYDLLQLLHSAAGSPHLVLHLHLGRLRRPQLALEHSALARVLSLSPWSRASNDPSIFTMAEKVDV